MTSASTKAFETVLTKAQAFEVASALTRVQAFKMALTKGIRWVYLYYPI
jgi:hypothetical protein